MNVLLVEDDEAVATSLLRALERYGYEVQWVANGGDALSAPVPDLVLLDLGLPDMDGLDVCRELRSRSSVPIIVISARTEEVDRVVGLEIGADDYMAKPFGVREVIARMRAVLRRSGEPRTDGDVRADADLAPVQFSGRLTIDRRARRVLVDGADVVLTPKEYDLLAFLTGEPGAVFTREQIMAAVWDENWFGPTKTLDVHIGALRRKLVDAISVETVRGVGFRVGQP